MSDLSFTNEEVTTLHHALISYTYAMQEKTKLMLEEGFTVIAAQVQREVTASLELRKKISDWRNKQ